jgi:hypothetical protein
MPFIKLIGSNNKLHSLQRLPSKTATSPQLVCHQKQQAIPNAVVGLVDQQPKRKPFYFPHLAQVSRPAAIRHLSIKYLDLLFHYS